MSPEGTRQADRIEELNSSYSEGRAGTEDRAPADRCPRALRPDLRQYHDVICQGATPPR